MRKSDSHGYVWALEGQWSYLMSRWGLAFVAGAGGPGQGRRRDFAGIAKALPNTLFVGCGQGFNKRLMGIFVTAGVAASPIFHFFN